RRRHRQQQQLIGASRSSNGPSLTNGLRQRESKRPPLPLSGLSRIRNAGGNNRMYIDNNGATGRSVRRFGLRVFGPSFAIGVEGRVKLRFGLSEIEFDTNVAKIATNVDNIATNTPAIDTNGSKMHTNIAEASSNASDTHRAGPETPSYLGETR